MTTPLDALIADEQTKIDLLRAKIKVCEHRIATLRSMQVGDDDLDAALAKSVGESHQPERSAKAIQAPERQSEKNAAPIPATGGDAFPKKTLGGASLKLLRFAGTTDKSIDEFVDFASSNGIGKSRQGMRAFLHQYKTTYKLVTSDRDGFFRLSDLGIAYLASLESGGTTSAQ